MRANSPTNPTSLARFSREEEPDARMPLNASTTAVISSIGPSTTFYVSKCAGKVPVDSPPPLFVRLVLLRQSLSVIRIRASLFSKLSFLFSYG